MLETRSRLATSLTVTNRLRDSLDGTRTPPFSANASVRQRAADEKWQCSESAEITERSAAEGPRPLGRGHDGVEKGAAHRGLLERPQPGRGGASGRSDSGAQRLGPLVGLRK